MTRTIGSSRTLVIGTTLTLLFAGCSAMLAGGPGGQASAPPQRMTDSAKAGAPAPDRDAAARSRIQAALGKLPLYFVKNGGQADSRVAYYVQGKNTAVYFGRDGVTFALTESKSSGAQTSADGEALAARVPVRLASTGAERPAAARRWAVKLDFVGARPVTPTAQQPASAVVSYWNGANRGGASSVETFRGVTYRDLWPGIDLVYTGAGGQLKSTFVVKPGADPDRIRLAYRGATGARVTETGQLEISTPVGSFAEDRPYAYQDTAGGRAEVSMAFALAAPSGDAQGYGFKVGTYDPSKPLVLDPSFLVYAGYIGGAGTDVANGIAVDAAGNAYVVGTTTSAVPGFPAKVGPDLTYNGGSDGDAFVAKVKADGSDLVYLGYIGGTGNDGGTAIAVDAAGYAYVTGYTSSGESSFPVKVGPGLTHFAGDSDAFVAKVKADGTGLVYCGYIGGASTDAGQGIAVDKLGNAYVTGWTGSDETSFPVKVGPGLIHHGASDAFVAKVKADGSALVYAGYIGGAADDYGYAIAVDAAGNAYVAGKTESDQITFPVKVGPDLNYNGGTDGFVAKVKADGTALTYAGYIGGVGLDIAFAIAVDATGNAYVTGMTTSDQATFPVKVGPDLIHNGYSDAFVVKVKPDGSGLVYAGYIGGAGEEEGFGIAVDIAGNAYVTGFTTSDETSFPIKLGPSLTFGGAPDAFVAKVKADGTGLYWAGYIGGASYDSGSAIAIDSKGNAYVAGVTFSDDATFPVTTGPDLLHGGGQSDAFVAKISGKPDLGMAAINIVTTTPVKPGGTFVVSDRVANMGLGASIPSTTRYYLSPDLYHDSNDILLGGTRAVPALAPGATTPFASTTVTVPANTPQGGYYVLACADDTNVNNEVDEIFNCGVTLGEISVLLGDLIEVSVSTGTSNAKPGDKITVTDTARNVAHIAAPASTTRYYLSVDTTKDAGDVLLTGTRAVPTLNPAQTAGDSSTGSASVTIPASTALGTYHILACADDTNAVKEASDTNNCVASMATITVTQPDLRTTAVSNTPASVKRGHSFTMSDVVTNVSLVGAGASTTRYYLSADSVAGGDILLTGTRAVGTLVANGTSSGLASLTVPASTAPGVYRVFACADDLKAVKEISDSNNCMMSGTLITINP